MFSIAICDDEEIVCSQIERYIEEFTKRELIKAEVFYTTEKLYKVISAGEHFDLIFLDIEFRLMNGVDLGNKIRNELGEERTQIVYISAKSEYALELFSVRPMNFLLKPLTYRSVMENIEKAMKLVSLNDAYFEFKFKSENYRVPYGDIVYFESNDRKIFVHTKRDVKQKYGRLNEIEKDAPYNFIRIHQSYLVNKIYITLWTYEKVILNDEIELPISKTYRKKVCKYIIESEG